MDTLTQKQIDLFLKDLTELTNKHKIVIGGCGCCESPWIEEADFIGEYHASGSDGGNLYFVEIKGVKWKSMKLIWSLLLV